MEKFTASNGLTVSVEPDDDMFIGGVPGVGGKVGLVGLVTKALREFFLHERDQELGRWGLCFLDGFGMADEGNHIGWFYNERTNHGFYADRDTNDRLYAAEEREVVAEYFAAHPEPKPWHHAKHNEIWVLFVSISEEAYRVDGSAFVPVNHPGRVRLALNDSRIQSGRRIWPEESSDG